MATPAFSRRRALRLGGSLLAVGLAGCGRGGVTDTDGGPADGEAGTGGGSDGGDSPSADANPTVPTDGTTTASTPDGTTGSGSGPGSTGTPLDVPDDLEVRAARVAAGFTSPVAVEIPRPGRRFVADQTGRIHLQNRGNLYEEPYLDVTDRMVDVSGFTERGLLGLAFHPARDGRFYVRYSAPPREGTPSNYSHTFVLSEFGAEPGARTADPDSERTVLEIPQPQSNHNAGAIVFGPDGYLYVAVGDGGGANDTGTGHVEDWYDATRGGNGQDVTENLLGSVLRIDVDGREDGREYAVPGDNPLVGREGLDEQFAWGFRNPWRMSFGPDNRLFVADVGQNAWEEVSIVERGGNYGWNVREGTHCFGADTCPGESPDGRRLRDPIIEYPHSGAPVSGISVIGGYLYDGSAVPSMQGRYVFADWRAGGRLFAATPTGADLWALSEVSVSSDEPFGPNVLSFGRNPDGELFVCTTAEGGVRGESGAVFRLGSTAD